jgi:hypothetical protein
MFSDEGMLHHLVNGADKRPDESADNIKRFF